METETPNISRKRAPAPQNMELFATCARKLSPLLAGELRALGIENVSENAAGVRFAGDLATAYRVILWTRTASRVLMPVGRFAAPTPEALYDGVRSIDWSRHMDYRKTIAVDLTSVKSAVSHTQYGALKVKDAMVDQFKEAFGFRINVNTSMPDLRINVHLHEDKAEVCIDLSGDSLHKRGYRTEGGAAPLRENLAAAILIKAGWPEIAARRGPLVDPMCGSGTFLVEGAMMAGNIAPGLLHNYFGFLGWTGHDKSLWAGLVGEAKNLAEAGKKKIPPIMGSDIHPKAVQFARANVARAGLAGYIKIEQRELAKARLPLNARGIPGLVAVNPPYGERMGSGEQLEALYKELGAVLKRRFSGYRAAIITSLSDAPKHIGLGHRKTNTLFNGPLECQLYRYRVE